MDFGDINTFNALRDIFIPGLAGLVSGVILAQNNKEEVPPENRENHVWGYGILCALVSIGALNTVRILTTLQ